MICGVDEAGRGPVIGPLVISGVMVDEQGIEKLLELGVKDSKAHTPIERETLYHDIAAIAKHHTVMVSAADLDELMGHTKLNEIEAAQFATVINTLSPSIVYIDSADVNCRRFELSVSGRLMEATRMVVEHRADEQYPVVSAASIMAKVQRDQEIAKLHQIYGDFGSGYPSDPKTKSFLERYFRENRSFPKCVRTKWKTAIMASNMRLEDFY